MPRGATYVAAAALLVAPAGAWLRGHGGPGNVSNATAQFPPAGGNAPTPRPAPADLPEDSAEVVRILHLSDTHNLHRTIEDKFPMPPADVLIHSGDLTDFGSDAELKDANAWLGELRSRYKHIITLTGNHDWIRPISLPAARNPEFWRQRLSNAKLMLQENVTVMGINIWGSSWKGGQIHGNPHNIGEVPEGVDIMVTHGPPAGIFDWTGTEHWGSSNELTSQSRLHHPKVHLFGHVHEQRGVWQRSSPTEKYRGGVEYEQHAGSGHRYPTSGPPPDDYPTYLISNNAMMNLPAKEGWSPHRIAGPARLIVARRSNGVWHFHT